MKPSIVYLHGFASGPSSTKGVALERRFAAAGVPFARVDLTPGDDGFERSTPASMLAIAEAELSRRPGPHAVIGSSLGGWLAALAASRNPSVERVVLLAPAFRLHARWSDRAGEAGRHGPGLRGGRPRGEAVQVEDHVGSDGWRVDAPKRVAG